LYKITLLCNNVKLISRKKCKRNCLGSYRQKPRKTTRYFNYDSWSFGRERKQELWIWRTYENHCNL